ncbi:MAG: PDGLE domain-containing protein [Candidatus Bathyarchaeota archaeon]|nr:PDGLE domain-containing protein [Candidatus Bathyarchaeota archaeon]
MKGYLKILIIILLCLAVLIPFASEFPDGLETVAETLGVEESASVWEGLMPDYQLPIIDNPYISTLAAGIFGVFLVFCATFILGIAISKKAKNK